MAIPSLIIFGLSGAPAKFERLVEDIFLAYLENMYGLFRRYYSLLLFELDLDRLMRGI